MAKEYLTVKNILVAIDDCENTTTASPIIKRTIELASAFSSKVWILHVIPQSQPPFNVDSQMLRKEIAAEYRHEHDFLHHLAQCLRDQEIDATAHLAKGTVIRTILNESDQLDIDLIVLGCHQHNLLYGALMEVTEEALLSKCPCPIMFVPALE